MKRIWTMIVILSFLSVLVGSFIMTAYGGPHTSICLATRLNGSEAPCPESDPVGFANFHGGALRQFSSLIVVDGSVLLCTVASCAAMMFSFFSTKSPREDSAKLAAMSFSNSKSLDYTLSPNELSWFSLHENSPAYS